MYINERGWIFFHFKAGGDHMRGLGKVYSFKKLDFILVLSFSQFCKIVWLYNTDNAFICF